ncbi:MAG: hypothetical protein ABH856_03945 [Patescibacteria group bacterium]|nr:hypothetical protein [Patescibacteria group bacterium]
MNQKEFRTVPLWVVYFFFVLGVVSAISFRIVIFFKDDYEHIARPIWYIGVIGYFFFFLYRYWISKRRKEIVKKYKLVKSLESKEKLSDDQREALLYLVSSIKKSRENYNYYIIFILSGLAIIFDLVLTYYR